MADSITMAILHEMDLAQLLACHNSIPGVLVLSRLSDPGTGRKRVEIALERAEHKLVRAPGGHRVVPLSTGVRTGRRITSVASNPRKPTGASHARYELYRVGMTMREYIEAAMATGITRKKARKDLYSDINHGYITVTE